MPIYPYKCSDCGFQKDYLRKISDPPLTTCESCGKETFQKMLTAAGFQLKGSGWYVTDFRDNGSKPDTKSSDSKKSAKTGDSTTSTASGGESSSGGADAGGKSADSSASSTTQSESSSAKSESSTTSGGSTAST